jgi:hypothetical protein
MLVVMLSWVSFWIPREPVLRVAPARTILGVMTVLTMTGILTGTNRAMPQVSYLKVGARTYARAHVPTQAVDIYLFICYFMVVASLLEFAIVSYGGKKKKDRQEKAEAAAKKRKEESNADRPPTQAEQNQARRDNAVLPPHKTHPLLVPRMSILNGNTSGVHAHDNADDHQSGSLPCTCTSGSGVQQATWQHDITSWIDHASTSSATMNMEMHVRAHKFVPR